MRLAYFHWAQLSSLASRCCLPLLCILSKFYQMSPKLFRSPLSFWSVVCITVLHGLASCRPSFAQDPTLQSVYCKDFWVLQSPPTQLGLLSCGALFFRESFFPCINSSHVGLSWIWLPSTLISSIDMPNHLLLIWTSLLFLPCPNHRVSATWFSLFLTAPNLSNLTHTGSHNEGWARWWR